MVFILPSLLLNSFSIFYLLSDYSTGPLNFLKELAESGALAGGKGMEGRQGKLSALSFLLRREFLGQGTQSEIPLLDFSLAINSSLVPW